MTENSQQANAQAEDLQPATVPPQPSEGSESPVLEPEQTTMSAEEAIQHEPGSIDEGWQIESETPPDAGAARASARGAPARGRGSNSERLTRVTLGSALIAMDTVNDRLNRLDEAEIEETSNRRTLDDVLVPMAQWQEQFGVAADQPMRHLMLGMVIDVRSKAGATVRFLNGIGNSMAGAINLILTPIRSQRVFRPVRHGFTKATDRGESQVERWRAMGRAEDSRSRAMAETALANAADETMDELITNERIEVFIQDVIEAQTVGILDEIIEEIRERTVSSDNFFERPIRRLLRRPAREQMPEPDLDRRMILPPTRRSRPIRPGSLLGHYAGFTSRLLAALIDIALIVVVLALGSTLLTTTVNVLGLGDRFDAFISSTGILMGVLTAINGLVFVFGYLFLFWLLAGQTLGMMLLGLRIISRTGGRLTFRRAVLRILGYIIFPVVFFLGFLWILVDDKREAWHDKLAGTYVVYAWDARPDETFLTYTMYMDN